MVKEVEMEVLDEWVSNEEPSEQGLDGVRGALATKMECAKMRMRRWNNRARGRQISRVWAWGCESMSHKTRREEEELAMGIGMHLEYR